MSKLHQYGRVLGRFSRTYWPKRRAWHRVKIFFWACLLRTNPRITNSEEDVNTLVSTGADPGIGLASVGTFHYTIALIHASQMTTEQLDNSIREFDLENPQQLNALIGILWRVATFHPREVSRNLKKCFVAPSSPVAA